ncbi:MAG: glutamate--tRNA ligase [Firmicutes bacterium]|nr:glutamate--tRNA ligase [Bacillota bacterium]
MDYNRLAELLFPHIQHDPQYYEELFPRRELPAEAKVTRIGPSPTGFVHLGNLYNAIIGERLAHQSQGVFFLRIEDTDNKREVPGAVETLLAAMDGFGVHFDEGATIDGETGSYGPYRQRQRKEIYQSIAKKLVQMGYAYPCFCTEDQLNAMREQQIAGKLNFGYYGQWAACRDMDYESIEARVQAGEPYVLRFRSQGDPENFLPVMDAIRGELSVQENYQDFVLLKSDGIPTYHFAHVVDDHLMGTTHVVRGEEWLATLPMHVQLFDTLGWQRPLYCHTAQLMKIDGDVKRKLSKRKDPELALEYYQAEGYLPDAVWEYLLTVLNSNYEQWRIDNPEAHYMEFPFSTEKMSNSGALFDLEKLENISKDVICAMSAEAIYEGLLGWAERYDTEFAALLADRDYALAVLNIGKGGDRPRKDLVNWKQAVDFLSFYYDQRFRIEDEFPTDLEARKEILSRYLELIDFSDDNDAWFAKVKQICEEQNYALQPKKYKKNPELYRGSIVEVSNTIRVAMSGRQNSPDLWQITQTLGEERSRARIRAAMEA